MSFYPFGDEDFDMDVFAKRFRLRPLQHKLFAHVMGHFHICVEFAEAEPLLTLYTMMPDDADLSTDVGVSETNLIDMLTPLIMNTETEVGHLSEIAALEELQSLCKRGIDLRRQLIEQHKAKEEA